MAHKPFLCLHITLHLRRKAISVIPLGPPSSTTPIVPDGTKFVLVPVTPSNSTAAPSAKTAKTSLPPGQQVVLRPAPGKPGSIFLCHYNGQMFQLKPVTTGPLDQPQPTSVSEGQCTFLLFYYFVFSINVKISKYIYIFDI